MTDTSPKNLRKFLESDDPALVRMGISMAKGMGVPDCQLFDMGAYPMLVESKEKYVHGSPPLLFSFPVWLSQFL